MTVSMRVMSAGDGYKYLLKTVVAADGDRPLSTPLTRYYMEDGTPPGRWLGAGVAALGLAPPGVGVAVNLDAGHLPGEGRALQRASSGRDGSQCRKRKNRRREKRAKTSQHVIATPTFCLGLNPMAALGQTPPSLKSRWRRIVLSMRYVVERKT